MLPSSTLSLLVERWGRRVSLSAADKQAILNLPATVRAFPRDAYLVREGEQTQCCGLLVSGLAYRQKLARDGARQIISFHIIGEFVDLQNVMLETADHNVQSLGRCEVATIPKAAIVALMKTHPCVGRALLLDTLIDASIFREWVVNVGRRDAKARIAHLLCELMLRMHRANLCDGTSCDFPITQEQLADATGLTTVHTNRVLQVLRREKLISLTSSKLTVLDWNKLAQHGDFSERYLHHGT